MTPGYEVGLRLNCGVPVVDLRGAWVATAVDQVVSVATSLVSAGHLDIVVNLQNAVVQGVGVLDRLLPLARLVRSRHGHIEVVAKVEQVESLAGGLDGGLFRLCTSELRAIGRIKRAPVRIQGLSCTARVGNH